MTVCCLCNKIIKNNMFYTSPHKLVMQDELIKYRANSSEYAHERCIDLIMIREGRNKK